MLILHSDVIANHVEQCETSANKEDIRKDGRYLETFQTLLKIFIRKFYLNTVNNKEMMYICGALRKKDGK